MIKPNLQVWLVPSILQSKPQILPNAFYEETKDCFNELLWGTYLECNEDLVTGIRTALQQATRPQITVILLHSNARNHDIIPTLDQLIKLFEGRPLHGLLLMGIFPFGITRPLPGDEDNNFVSQVRRQNLAIKTFFSQKKRADPLQRQNILFTPTEPSIIPFKAYRSFKGPYLEAITRNNVGRVMDGVTDLMSRMEMRFWNSTSSTTATEIPEKRSKTAQGTEPMEEA